MKQESDGNVCLKEMGWCLGSVERLGSERLIDEMGSGLMRWGRIDEMGSLMRWGRIDEMGSLIP